ncbi:MAG TPA: M3 family oligoendopeptidase [Kofleriaceae bacterium]|nr:M3 family oligoendopeptidase [Kofleriaceae bacterium]
MANETGAENVHWELSDLYTGVDDAAIERDLGVALELAKQFDERHRGTLAQTLGAALTAQARISELVDKLMVYLFLQRSTDAANGTIQQRIGKVQEAWSQAEADHLTFFEHELAAMPEEAYAALLARDEVVQQHRSMLDHMRETARYLLSEPVERALTLRSPFGPSEWSDYAEEWEAELSFELEGQPKSLPEILHVINNDADGDRRALALDVFSKGITEQRFDRFSARTLNVTLGAKAVEDRERGYSSPMSARNIGNRVDDATVEALHEAVADVGAAQCRRYYRLLSRHLSIAPLRWSDRNAPLPFQDTRTVPWSECIETVLQAYGSFSPTLRGHVASMLDRKWVDAPPYKGKVGGAFNYSVCLPGGDVRAYNFLNYMGSTRDVMTVAHELGHGVHGLLAGAAQGPLLFRAPMVYAETASIFGEMTTFDYVLANADSDQQRLALLMGKANDFLNSVVRQISFSNFERQIHARRRDGKLTVEELNELWMGVTRAFYGDDGDLFTYDNTHNLWAYVSHFLRPFYVYAYAFGELFTQSLFAIRERFGAEFEPMYLELLRAGGTKSAVELMKPFGLDPTSPAFWQNGVTGSVARWLDEAERITDALA